VQRRGRRENTWSRTTEREWEPRAPLPAAVPWEKMVGLSIRQFQTRA
jgi:hypothetical protein